MERMPDNVVWKPQKGSQEAFLSSSSIFEVLYQGTRGGGKTDCLIFSFGQYCGRGYGAAWKGVLFRQTYKQLSDVIAKTKKWFPQIWPQAKFNNSEHVWTWPDGEQLLLRQYKRDDDYNNYHGHEYPWIGWEELTNWATDSGYKRMMSTCRSSTPGMPRMIRATTNPYGPGHGWVKARFLPDTMNMKVRTGMVDMDGIPEPPRLSIFSNLSENLILLKTDPEYINKIAASARNAAEKAAWLEGRWDIISGGMFDDVYQARYNVVKPFVIPHNWKIDRSFDWGSSKPYSVGWWAESNGEDVILPDGTSRSTVRGDLFRIGELYGWTGKPNEGVQALASDITKDIVKWELAHGYRDRFEPNWCRVKTGVADAQIFAAENGNCIATDMKMRVRLEDGIRYKGVNWIAADKRAGSRVTGWDQMRRMLKYAHPTILVEDKSGEENHVFGPRERPGMFIFSTCENWIRTVPVIPRDEGDPDDVDTDVEDHCADETRYKVRFTGRKVSQGKTTGLS